MRDDRNNDVNWKLLVLMVCTHVGQSSMLTESLIITALNEFRNSSNKYDYN